MKAKEKICFGNFVALRNLCDKMYVDLKMLKIIYHGMFPYNDEENAWITKT